MSEGEVSFGSDYGGAEVFAEQQDLALALTHAQQASELSEQLDDSKFAEAVSELVAQLEQATTEQ
mgnify:CR=1 FL=1